MFYYILKFSLSTGIIVAVSEIAKFNTGLGVMESLPLISILAIIWLYLETKDTMKIAELSIGTFRLARRHSRCF